MVEPDPQVDPLVEQLGLDGGRRLVDELIGLEECLDLLALDGSRARGWGVAIPLGSRRLSALRGVGDTRWLGPPDRSQIATFMPTSGVISSIASSINSIRRSPLCCPWRVAPTARKVFPGSRRPVSTCRDRRPAVRPWPSSGRSRGRGDRPSDGLPVGPGHWTLVALASPVDDQRRVQTLASEQRPPGRSFEAVIFGQDLGLVLGRELPSARGPLGDLRVRWGFVIHRTSMQRVSSRSSMS